MDDARTSPSFVVVLPDFTSDEALTNWSQREDPRRSEDPLPSTVPAAKPTLDPGAPEALGPSAGWYYVQIRNDCGAVSQDAQPCSEPPAAAPMLPPPPYKPGFVYTGYVKGLPPYWIRVRFISVPERPSVPEAT